MPQMKFTRDSVYCEMRYPTNNAELVVLWSGLVLRRKPGTDWQLAETSRDLATTVARAQWLGWRETYCDAVAS